MTRIKIKQLIWDEFNVEHIKKHKVTVSEVEAVGRNILTHEQTKLGRYLVIGRIGSRILAVIIKRKRIGVYYPITARDAAKRERRKVYEKEKRTKIS